MIAPTTQVGVLALQGDFEAHAQALARQGAQAREIRRPEELAEVEGLVLPGGETTTMIKLLRETGLWDAVAAAPDGGQPVFGTCAGLILLAREVTDPEQPSLGLLPVTVRRNAYGRQVDSFVEPGQVRVPADLAAELAGDPGAVSNGGLVLPTEFVFIRAPRITALHGDVEVLARRDGEPVLVRSGRVLGGSFHPELTRDGVVVRLFLAMIAQARAQRPRGNGSP